MDETTTIAWIFYAVEMGSSKGPANRQSISLLADAINHAVPTHEEVEFSLKWLLDSKLLLKERKSFRLSPEGRSLFAKASNEHKYVQSVWERLAAEISKLYHDNVAESGS
jgi:hypothetical protein